MSFWTNFRIPGILGALSGAAAVGASVSPSNAALFNNLSMLFGGAALHSVNPNQSTVSTVAVTTVPDQPAPVPVVQPAPVVQTVQTAPVQPSTPSAAMVPQDAIFQIVALALQNYEQSKATPPAQPASVQAVAVTQSPI